MKHTCIHKLMYTLNTHTHIYMYAVYIQMHAQTHAKTYKCACIDILEDLYVKHSCKPKRVHTTICRVGIFPAQNPSSRDTVAWGGQVRV